MSDEPVTPDDIRARVADSPYAPLLHDGQHLHDALAGLMAASGHPVLAEMGRALTEGGTGWRDLARVGAYREVLDAGFTALGRIDLEAVTADLDAARESGWVTRGRGAPG